MQVLLKIYDIIEEKTKREGRAERYGQKYYKLKNKGQWEFSLQIKRGGRDWSISQQNRSFMINAVNTKVIIHQILSWGALFLGNFCPKVGESRNVYETHYLSEILSCQECWCLSIFHSIVCSDQCGQLKRASSHPSVIITNPQTILECKYFSSRSCLAPQNNNLKSHSLTIQYIYYVPTENCLDHVFPNKMFFLDIAPPTVV